MIDYDLFELGDVALQSGVTLRQARYVANIDAHNAEPDVLAAAAICENAEVTVL